jgi:hypothetical protein
LQHQKAHKDNRDTGKWYTYRDVFTVPGVVTAEDFIQASALKRWAETMQTSLGLDDPPDFSCCGPCIPALGTWFQRNGKTPADTKRLLNEFKELAFSQLRRADIREAYYEYLCALTDLVAEKKE